VAFVAQRSVQANPPASRMPLDRVSGDDKMREILCVICLLLMPVTASASPPAPKAHLLAEFRDCLRALPQRVDKRVVSPCAEGATSNLVGLGRSSLLFTLGKPDWCSSGHDEVLLWSERVCSSANVWGYSFYRLPSTSRGGGPELAVVFGGSDSVVDASWWHSK
jgi:hypothetical protein